MCNRPAASTMAESTTTETTTTTATSSDIQYSDGMVEVKNEEKEIKYNTVNPRVFILFVDFVCPLIVYKSGLPSSPKLLLYTFIMWWIQMTGALACFHRYFAHRSFKAGRVWTACMGILGCISGQAGPLHWADHHRLHHKHCEKEVDIHSPVTNGGIDKYGKIGAFFWAQGVYLLVQGIPTDYHKRVADWSRYPELCFIDWAADKIYFGIGIFLWKYYSWEMGAYAWALPTFLSMNCVQLVNSAAHLIGEYKYQDPRQHACRARNIWWLTPLMLGANWHNNHHAFPHCARAGMEWYEIDPMYYTIKFWELLGLVYDVREPDMEKLKALRVKQE